MKKTEQIERDIKRFLGLNELNQNEVHSLIPILSYQEFNPGDIVLEEGVLNQTLFFIISGSLAVTRSKEIIATINQSGEIFGEMGIICSEPTSARTIATSPLSVFCLNTQLIDTLPEPIKYKLLHAMNQTFSKSLVKKLLATNEKARLFEITNRELKLAQIHLEKANQEKNQAFNAHQKQVYQQIKNVLDFEIKPMRKNLSDLAADSKDQLEAISHLNKVITSLEPLLHGLENKKEISDTRVLILEDDINEQINIKLSLAGIGVDYSIANTQDDAEQLLKEKKFNIMCINSSNINLIPSIHKIQPQTHLVFMTSESILKHFQTLQSFPELSAIITRHPDDRSFTIKNITTTIQKLLSNDIFGIEKYLNWGTSFTEIVVVGSNQRQEILEKLETDLEALGIRNLLRRKAIKIAEELLMNAIYDAPTNQNGDPIYNHLNRTIPIELKPEEHASFKYACDGNYLALSIVDTFGGLTKNTILNYLSHYLTNDQQGDLPQSPKKGGGGNGLYQIIQSSSLTIFNIKPKVTTEVISLINLNVQMEKISLHPSFHYFEI